MPDTPSITTIKRFDYRGVQEEFSNTYHFAGSAPANVAAWKTLADTLIAAEKTCFGPEVAFVRAYGYNAGNEHSVAQIDYVALGGALVVGTLNPSGLTRAPGDAAVWLRALVGLSSTGKKVYVRKYFHGVYNGTATDGFYSVQKGNMATLGTNLCMTSGGLLPGGWSGPQGAVATAPQVGPFVTTRTLKRRGKRP